MSGLINPHDTAPRVWLGFALLALIYCVGYGLLVFPSAITEELIAGLHLSDVEMSFISSSFLLTYVAMQLPAGMLLDILPIRRVLLLVCVVMALGCFLMAGSHSLWMTILSRCLMGVGASFTFLACLTYGRIYFVPAIYALLVGLTEMMSGLGAISFNTALSVLVQWQSWRQVIVEVGGLALVLGVALYVVVHQHRGFQKKTLNYPFRTQFYLVLRRRRVWLLAFYTGLSFAHFMVLTNLWSATFLRQRYHISDELAVMVNALCMMGFILGCPLFGFLSRYVSPRKLLAGGALAQCMLLMAVFYQALPLPVDGALLLLQGVATGSVVLVFKLVRHYVPKRVLGMASGLVNLFFGGIAMLITPLVGLIYQHTNDVHLALFPVMLASGTALLCLLTLYVLDQRQLSLKLP